MKQRIYYLYRSSITGLFVSKETAEADPDHHVRERVVLKVPVDPQDVEGQSLVAPEVEAPTLYPPTSGEAIEPDEITYPLPDREIFPIWYPDGRVIWLNAFDPDEIIYPLPGREIFPIWYPDGRVVWLNMGPAMWTPEACNPNYGPDIAT